MAGLSYEEKVARCMKSFEGLKAMNEPDPKRLIDVPPAPNQDDIPLHIYDGRGRIRFNVPLVTAGGSYFNAKGKLKQTPEPKPEDSDEASTEDARKDKAPASNPASTAKASSDSVDEADSAKKDESKKAEVDPHEDEDDESLPPPNRFDVTPYLRGLADGKGTVGLPDGATYEGECENGKRHGKGTFTATNGMEYEGEWNEDQMCGEGKMTFLDGTKEEGFWDPKQQNKWVRRRMLKTREDVLLEKKLEDIERKKFQKEAQQAYETQKGQPQPSRCAKQAREEPQTRHRQHRPSSRERQQRQSREYGQHKSSEHGQPKQNRHDGYTQDRQPTRHKLQAFEEEGANISLGEVIPSYFGFLIDG